MRRIYLRHDALKEDDLYVPCADLETLEDLRLEASARLRRLGVTMPQEGVESLVRKSGAPLDLDRRVQDTLVDSEVIVAVARVDSDTNGTETAHVRVKHSSLRDDVRMWQPVQAGWTVKQLKEAVEENLKLTEPNCSVLTLWCDGAICPLPDDVPCSKVLENGQVVVAVGPEEEEIEGEGEGGEADKAKKSAAAAARRDSSLWKNPRARWTSTSSVTSAAASESSSPFGSGIIAKKIDVGRLQANKRAPANQPGKDTVAFVQEQTHQNGRRPSWLLFFANADYVRRLPGGSWAVFGDNSSPPQRRTSWLSRLGRGQKNKK